MTKIEKLVYNTAAIRTALRLYKEKARPTEAESAVLNLYSGFGGLKCILLDPNKPEQFSNSEKNLIPYVKILHKELSSYSIDEKEYEKYFSSLKTSVLSAFYTPKEIVDSIGSAFAKNKLSFDRVLDPSAGTGAFLNINAKEYTAIEKDLLTGKILKALNPDKDINVSGFEEIPAKYNGTFDLAVSNIPFGDFKVFDPAFYNNKVQEKRLSCNKIHNYFFLKAADMVKNGGMIAFMTSTGFMDSPSNEFLRKHLIKEHRLITAVRLPENLFSSAGTEAQCDLVILQKNLNRPRNLSNDEQLWLKSDNVAANGASMNSYFYQGLKNIVHTELRHDTNMYGKPDVRFFHSGGVDGIARDMEKFISEGIKRNYDFSLTNTVKVKASGAQPVQLSLFDDFDTFIKKVEKTPRKKTETHFIFENPACNNEGSYQTDGINIGIAEDKYKAKILEVDERLSSLVKSYIGVRDAYFLLKRYEETEKKENPALRAALNERYDEFEEAHGAISHSGKELSNDTFFPEIKGLEFAVAGEIKKSDIFFMPVAFSNEKITYSLDEALSVCLNKFNNVNLSYISGLSQKNESDVVAGLEGKIFYDPEIEKYRQADLYLSGNVIEKFNIAHAAYISESSPMLKVQLQNSMKALHNVFPAKVPFEDIGISLGERWIPEAYYSAFASVMFQSEMNVKYEPIIDEFSISGNGSYLAMKKYSVQSANRYYSSSDVLRFALLDNTPDMHMKIRIGGKDVTVPDNEGIQKMNANVSLLQNEFKVWLQNIPLQNKEELENLYNSKFNCFVKPRFDGSFQTFPDLDFKSLGYTDLYRSQKDAILMIKNQNGGIIDHKVGGGKTLIQCVAAYEMKRLGLVNKPCILGLKTNVGQIADTFKKAYPDAKLLYATESDFAKERRMDFFNKIQNNDWDCIIMSHSQFKAIPQSLDIQRDIIKDEIKKIKDAIRGVGQEKTGNYKYIEKGLLKRKENLSVKLNNIISGLNEKKDNVVDFRSMGIDHLFLDESHVFKNLMFQTRHQRVAGLGNPAGSERSLNMLFAIRTIQKRNGSDLGATFLSGTTISNSLTELYSIFNYLRPEAMKKQNIHSFDAWVGTYALKSKDFEFNVTNDIVQKERFRHFIKVPELSMFYSQITDYKTADDIGLERPEKNEIFIALEQTKQQKDMFLRLKDFAKTGDGTIIYRDKLTNSEEKARMLIATNTAKKAALDMRLIDPERFTDEPGNRTDVAANKIYEYYKRYDTYKGTQFIFADTGTYKPGKDFDIYSDIKKKLVAMGIPANEIQFVQTAKNDDKKLELFKKMNSGECRVLFGSTEMLGTGVNAQEKCIAIHHFDIPWTPKDLEQREGRGVRTGNDVAKLYANNKVDVLVYATKGTLDTYKFNLLKNKELFISQIKTSSISVRSIDEGGMDKNSGMNFSEYIAVLSGNTDLLEKAKLEKVLAQLKGEESIYLKQIRSRQNDWSNLSSEMTKNEKFIFLFKEDLKTFQSFPRDKEENPIVDYVIGGKQMTDLREIGEEINLILDKVNKDSVNYQPIGKYGSFDLLVKSEVFYGENGNEVYKSKMFVGGNLKYGYNNGDVARTPKLAAIYPLNALKRIEGLITTYENKNKGILQKIEALKSLNFEFPKKEELRNTEILLEEVNERINRSINPINEEIENKQMTGMRR